MLAYQTNTFGHRVYLALTSAAELESTTCYTIAHAKHTYNAQHHSLERRPRTSRRVIAGEDAYHGVYCAVSTTLANSRGPRNPCALMKAGVVALGQSAHGLARRAHPGSPVTTAPSREWAEPAVL